MMNRPAARKMSITIWIRVHALKVASASPFGHSFGLSIYSLGPKSFRSLHIWYLRRVPYSTRPWSGPFSPVLFIATLRKPGHDVCMSDDRKNPLQRQLEDQRFLSAVQHVLLAARGIKKINSMELAHLNQILRDSNDEPWRFEETEIQLPSGTLHLFNIVSNPINKARDLLGEANQIAGNGQYKEAALYVYSELVLAHLFNDANRRTAVLATIWILESGGISVDAQKLLEIPLGDLRNLRDRDTFTKAFEALLVPQ